MFKLTTGFLCLVLLLACQPQSPKSETDSVSFFDKQTILTEADQYLSQAPVPLTASHAERSAGTPNDFYSEGDYWWPNPEDPDGPYIRKDGQTNPDNFIAHRLAMRDLGRWVASLTAAYKMTKDQKYADAAFAHLKAWFIDPETQMNPSLLYAQAIKGRVTGRGIGIIDTIHLIEVAKSIEVLKQLGYLKEEDFRVLVQWFATFVDWLSSHPYGIDERDHGNNHSTWWAAQVAAFAALAHREDLLTLCRAQFKKLLAEQMDENGGFPDELSRTKPYNYSLFNLEGYTVLAHIASTPQDPLWRYQSPNGSLEKAIHFLLPSIQDKSNWPFAPDVQHFEELPIQSASLLLAGKAYDHATYLSTWQQLSPKRQSKEVDRTYPIRQLSLWVD